MGGTQQRGGDVAAASRERTASSDAASGSSVAEVAASNPSSDSSSMPQSRSQLGGNAFRRGPTRGAVLLDCNWQHKNNGLPRKNQALPAAKRAREQTAKHEAQLPGPDMPDSDSDNNTEPDTYVDGNATDSSSAPSAVNDSSNPSKRPRVSRGLSKLQTSSGTSATVKLERAILGGLLWVSKCSTLAPELTEQVPTSFQSLEHYISVFEPLLHEEAREGVRNAYQESLEAGRGWSVDMGSVTERPDGWYSASVCPQPGSSRKELLKDGCIVVLTKLREQPAAISRLLRKRLGDRPPATVVDHACKITGIVRQGMRTADDPVKIEFYPACPYHSHADAASPCMAVTTALQQKPQGWQIMPAGNLITAIREVETLGRMDNIKLLPCLLQPVQHAAAAGGQLARVWPRDFSNPEQAPLLDWLRSTYDLPQREAIEIATSHLAEPELQAASPTPVLPVTLIQGPPGTGKTHTVLGILNTWHIIQYRRHQDAWLSEARAVLERMSRLAASAASRGFTSSSNASLSALLAAAPPAAVPKPRILVCAPSNAATDELLERILSEGFRDTRGGTYRPPVVRVGSGDAPLSEEVRKVWTENLVRRYLDMSREVWTAEYRSKEAKALEAEHHIGRLVTQLEGLGLTGQDSSGKGTITKQAMQLAGKLVELCDRRAQALLERSRLEAVAPRFVPRGSFNERQARDDLELSFVEGAELVFATLSSTGRRVFSRLSRGFDTVLIDEAAQAAEVAALQPLVHGASKVVLVGDPQQLPATLFSARAKDVLLERSLFERLQQAGFPVKLLSVQYRMHPEIRSFPSSYFYNNQLKDGSNVVNAPPASFYESELLKPYVVYDVAHGVEASGRSRSNKAEAELAAALFWELRCVLMEQVEAARVGRRPPPERATVGIITPYRSQRDLLRQTFRQLLGPEVAAEARIETVDSFQGKQLDVVILSCVRAGDSGGVGFLSDTRRMNVAITRAKKALWVLGKSKALQRDPTWSALLRDAEKRDVIIHDAVAEELFPRFAALKQRLLAPPAALSTHPLPLPGGHMHGTGSTQQTGATAGALEQGQNKVMVEQTAAPAGTGSVREGPALCDASAGETTKEGVLGADAGGAGGAELGLDAAGAAADGNQSAGEVPVDAGRQTTPEVPAELTNAAQLVAVGTPDVTEAAAVSGAEASPSGVVGGVSHGEGDLEEGELPPESGACTAPEPATVEQEPSAASVPWQQLRQQQQQERPWVSTTGNLQLAHPSLSLQQQQQQQQQPLSDRPQDPRLPQNQHFEQQQQQQQQQQQAGPEHPPSALQLSVAQEHLPVRANQTWQQQQQQPLQQFVHDGMLQHQHSPVPQLHVAPLPQSTSPPPASFSMQPQPTQPALHPPPGNQPLHQQQQQQQLSPKQHTLLQLLANAVTAGHLPAQLLTDSSVLQQLLQAVTSLAHSPQQVLLALLLQQQQQQQQQHQPAVGLPPQQLPVLHHPQFPPPTSSPALPALLPPLLHAALHPSASTSQQPPAQHAQQFGMSPLPPPHQQHSSQPAMQIEQQRQPTPPAYAQSHQTAPQPCFAGLSPPLHASSYQQHPFLTH